MTDSLPSLFSSLWSDRYATYPPARNAREAAFRIIRDKIIFLELKPGEPLSDKLLAEELKMSRTPVREAVIILTTLNMVVLKPQVGTFVAPIDVEWMQMEQFARMALEKEVIRCACSRVTEEVGARYAYVLDSYDSEIAALGDPPYTADRLRRLLELDNDFHRVAFQVVGRDNSFLHMQRDMQHIERLRVLSMTCEGALHLTADHRAISEAVLAGDGERACSLLEKHLTLYHESIEKVRERFPSYFTLG